MKLSLAWIFDYIDIPLSRFSITEIVDRFNKTTAEIERWSHIVFKKDEYAATIVKECKEDSIVTHCYEWSRDIILPIRSSATIGACYIIKKDGKEYRWATMQDWHSSKEGLLPAMLITKEHLYGTWKDSTQELDYVIEIDNKSITHRPDLWGHEGVAREIAAMLNASFKPLTYQKCATHFANTKGTFGANEQVYHIEIKDPSQIQALTALSINYIPYQATIPSVAYRLCIVDGRPLNAPIDGTNYVLFDIGHPLHAFDASKIDQKKIVARMAYPDESLHLLDNSTIDLTPNDIIIADNKKSLSLAGVMGGIHSSVSQQATSLVIEAGCFNPTTIRHTTTRYKKRTDAAIRFEKGLTPYKTIDAINRYIHYLNIHAIMHEGVSDICALGAYPKQSVIKIGHAFIEKRLGIVLETNTITTLLQSLGFSVTFHTNMIGGEYAITIPTNRIKDITIKEDIIEEIARAFGYGNITPQTPEVHASISDLSAIYRRRKIKDICQQSLRLQEVYSYALYDEQFLRAIEWSPQNSIRVKEPLSEERQQLITHLLPQLFQIINTNVHSDDELRFFEMARVWSKDFDNYEQHRLAGIIYHKKNTLSFYDAKAYIDDLLHALGMENCITWRPPSSMQPWFAPYQTASLVYNNAIIGNVGVCHPLFLEKIAPGSALIFEIDIQTIIEYQPKTKHIKAPSKYPDVIRDISILVPTHLLVETIEEKLSMADPHIVAISLEDFFEKEEWGQYRSLTFRYTLRDYEKTMTKQECDTIHNHIIIILKTLGAQIR